jgi:hypothetical protein
MPAEANVVQIPEEELRALLAALDRVARILKAEADKLDSSKKRKAS